MSIPSISIENRQISELSEESAVNSFMLTDFRISSTTNFAMRQPSDKYLSYFSRSLSEHSFSVFSEEPNDEDSELSLEEK